MSGPGEGPSRNWLVIVVTILAALVVALAALVTIVQGRFF